MSDDDDEEFQGYQEMEIEASNAKSQDINNFFHIEEEEIGEGKASKSVNIRKQPCSVQQGIRECSVVLTRLSPMDVDLHTRRSSSNKRGAVQSSPQQLATKRGSCNSERDDNIFKQQCNSLIEDILYLQSRNGAGGQRKRNAKSTSKACKVQALGKRITKRKLSQKGKGGHYFKRKSRKKCPTRMSDDSSVDKMMQEGCGNIQERLRKLNHLVDEGVSVNTDDSCLNKNKSIDSSGFSSSSIGDATVDLAVCNKLVQKSTKLNRIRTDKNNNTNPEMSNSKNRMQKRIASPVNYRSPYCTRSYLRLNKESSPKSGEVSSKNAGSPNGQESSNDANNGCKEASENSSETQTGLSGTLGEDRRSSSSKTSLKEHSDKQLHSTYCGRIHDSDKPPSREANGAGTEVDTTTTSAPSVRNRLSNNQKTAVDVGIQTSENAFAHPISTNIPRTVTCSEDGALSEEETVSIVAEVLNCNQYESCDAIPTSNKNREKRTVRKGDKTIEQYTRDVNFKKAKKPDSEGPQSSSDVIDCDAVFPQIVVNGEQRSFTLEEMEASYERVKGLQNRMLKCIDKTCGIELVEKELVKKEAEDSTLETDEKDGTQDSVCSTTTKLPSISVRDIRTLAHPVSPADPCCSSSNSSLTVAETTLETLPERNQNVSENVQLMARFISGIYYLLINYQELLLRIVHGAQEIYANVKVWIELVEQNCMNLISCFEKEQRETGHSAEPIISTLHERVAEIMILPLTYQDILKWFQILWKVRPAMPLRVFVDRSGHVEAQRLAVVLGIQLSSMNHSVGNIASQHAYSNQNRQMPPYPANRQQPQLQTYQPMSQPYSVFQNPEPEANSSDISSTKPWKYKPVTTYKPLYNSPRYTNMPLYQPASDMPQDLSQRQVTYQQSRSESGKMLATYQPVANAQNWQPTQFVPSNPRASQCALIPSGQARNGERLQSIKTSAVQEPVAPLVQNLRHGENTAANGSNDEESQSHIVGSDNLVPDVTENNNEVQEDQDCCVCHKPAMLICSLCWLNCYCSESCQLQHWRESHHDECTAKKKD